MGILSDNLARVCRNLAAFDPTSNLADRLAWVRDSEDNDFKNYPGPGWQDEPYEPSDDDLAEYAEWSRSLDPGVPTDALTVEEMDLLVNSCPDRQFREMLQDELAERYAAERS